MVMGVLRAGRYSIPGVAVIPRLVITVEINIEEEINSLAFGFQGREQLRRSEHIVYVVVEHVQVIEDIGGVGKAT